MGEASIVSNCDLKFVTPKAGLSSIIAISNLTEPTSFSQVELSQLNKKWSNAHKLLKRRYAATKPGVIHGIFHEYFDEWKIQIKYRSKNNTPKTEYYGVDTAFGV